MWLKKVFFHVELGLRAAIGAQILHSDKNVYMICDLAVLSPDVDSYSLSFTECEAVT